MSAPLLITRTVGRYRVLDFDLENRPLSYLGQDFTTAEITALAASFGPGDRMYSWVVTLEWFRDPETRKAHYREMLEEFRDLYDQADMVTGHYIRKHDLPILNGAMLEYGLRPLGPKLTCDTKLDLAPMKDISRSQESIGAMLELAEKKYGMSQSMWREANRLERPDLAYERVTSDVRQHQSMRAQLLEQGMLKPPRTWSANA